MTLLKEPTFTIKVLINKDHTKVLFAEIDNDFADVLLSFLTLPLGTIVRLLRTHFWEDAPVIGSLNTLYKSIKNLESDKFCTNAGKDMLVYPRNAYNNKCSKLKINVDDTPPTRYFFCGSTDCTSHSYYWDISLYHGVGKCNCGKLIETMIGDHDMRRKTDGKLINEDREVFTKKTVSFLITDDLRMVPNVTESIIQTITELGITDTDGAEKITLAIGFSEIMDLLRASLISKTPFTDLIIHKREDHNKSRMMKPKPLPELYLIEKDKSWFSRKMSLKVMIQKSTNMFLFAQAKKDFVDFLFSFLTIPLGQVESLLKGNASFGSIDNLYTSLSKLNDDAHLKSYGIKEGLLKPNLPPKYLSKNQLFPLTEQISTPEMNYCENKYMAHFVDPKGEGSYVKEGGMYIVFDDLTVTPLLLMSSLSTLEELKIPLTDVEEHVISIGVDEALSILKASLTSLNAFTDGLNYFLLKKFKEGKVHYLPHVLMEKLLCLE